MYVGNAQRFAVKITPAKASKAKLDGKQATRRSPKSVQKELSHLSKQEKQRSHVT